MPSDALLGTSEFLKRVMSSEDQENASKCDKFMKPLVAQTLATRRSPLKMLQALEKINERFQRNYDRTRYRRLKDQVPEMDHFEISDEIYRDQAISKQCISSLSGMRRKIANQRHEMKELEEELGDKMTLIEWEEEDEIMKKMVEDYKWHLDQMMIDQEKEMLQLDSQYRQSLPSTSSSKLDNLLPKEKVARQLLVDNLPNSHTTTFLSRNFTRDEFLEFQTKMRDRCRDHQKKLLLMLSESGRKYRSTTSAKRKLMNDMAEKVKLWERFFHQQVLQSNKIWPSGVPNVEFSTMEMELIDLMLELPVDCYRAEQESYFSLSELEELDLKIEYRINILIDAISWINTRVILKTVFPEDDSELRMEMTPPSMEKARQYSSKPLTKSKLKETNAFYERVAKRINHAKMNDLRMFLLQPAILENLTVEERMFFADCATHTVAGYTRWMFTLETLKQFENKLDRMEQRKEEEKAKNKKKRNPSIWFPADKIQSKHRHAEDCLLLQMFFMITFHKKHNLRIPALRAEHIRDFRFMFSNRRLMLNKRHQMLCADGSGEYDDMMVGIFYERYMKPKKKSALDEVTSTTYDESILTSLEWNKIRREEIAKIEKMMEEEGYEEESSPSRRKDDEVAGSTEEHPSSISSNIDEPSVQSVDFDYSKPDFQFLKNHAFSLSKAIANLKLGESNRVIPNLRDLGQSEVVIQKPVDLPHIPLRVPEERPIQQQEASQLVPVKPKTREERLKEFMEGIENTPEPVLAYVVRRK